MTSAFSRAALALLDAEYAACGTEVEVLQYDAVTVVLHEKETAPLLHGLNVIAPVSFRAVTAGRGDKCVIHCAAYPALYDTARTFFAQWYGAPFSHEALSDLHAALVPQLAEWGYGGAKFPRRYGVARLLTLDGVTERPIRDGVRMLDASDAKRPSLVTMKLSDGIARGAAGYLTEGGEVAAMAAVNGTLDMHRFAELGVECAPAYRGQGIASEVTECLCNALLANGKTPLYCHYCDNYASGALAARVGFSPAGAFYTYQAWKK